MSIFENIRTNRAQWHDIESYYFQKEKKLRSLAEQLEFSGLILAILSIVFSVLGFRLSLIFSYLMMVAIIISYLFSWRAQQSHDAGEYARRTSFYIGFIDEEQLVSIAKKLWQGREWNLKNPDYYYDLGIEDDRLKFAKDFLESIYFQTNLITIEKEHKSKRIYKLISLLLVSAIGVDFVFILFPDLALFIMPILIVIIPYCVNEFLKFHHYNKMVERIQEIEKELLRLIKRKYHTQKLLFGCLNLEMEYSITLSRIPSVSDKLYNEEKKRLQKEVKQLIDEEFGKKT